LRTARNLFLRATCEAEDDQSLVESLSTIPSFQTEQERSDWIQVHTY
jgi:hypothetical protein